MPASPSTSNLSDTLQQITLIKIAELDKKHQTYDARKRQALDYKSIEIGGSKTWSRTSQLAGEIPGTYIPFIDHAKLQNIISYLQQASVDPSVTETEISRYEQWLLAHLDYQSNRLDHATLFSAVLSEHLGCSSETSTDQSEGMSIDDDSLDGPFEMLTRDRLQQLRENSRMSFSMSSRPTNKLFTHTWNLFSLTSKGSASLRVSVVASTEIPRRYSKRTLHLMRMFSTGSSAVYYIMIC